MDYMLLFGTMTVLGARALTCVIDPFTLFSSTRGKHIFLYSLSFSTLIKRVASSTNKLFRRAYLHSREKSLKNKQKKKRLLKKIYSYSSISHSLTQAPEFSSGTASIVAFESLCTLR